jgi:AcrR family transcriptional regulator
VAAAPPHRAGPDLPAPAPPGDARERILGTAYRLFNAHGLAAVGVDRIVAEAEVAKTTLYRHFRSKDDLAVAVLGRHEQTWTHDWLEQEATRRATSAQPAIIAVFAALDAWYREDSFEGCLFMNTVLETHRRDSTVRTTAVAATEDVYALLERFAADAGVRDAETFAHQIQILMRGSIVAAVEGHFEAVEQARAVAQILLEREGERRQDGHER